MYLTLPFYHGIVCISCLIRMDMGHLDEVSSLRAVALGVVAHVYHELQQRLVRWQLQHEPQHLSERGSEPSHDVVVHALGALLVGRVLGFDHGAR